MRILHIPALLITCAGLLAQTEKPPVSKATQKGVNPAKLQAKPKAAPRPYVLIKTSLGSITVELFSDEAPKTVANFLGLVEGTKASKNPTTGKMEKRKFYDGVVFHRVIKNFMAQSGCPLGTGRGNPGFQFGDEISAKSLGLDKMMVATAGRRNFRSYSLSEEDWTTHVMRPLYDELSINTREDLDKNAKKLEKMLEETSVLSVYQRLGFQYDDSRSSHPMQRGTLAMANSGPGTNGSQFFINFKNNEFLNGKHTVFGRVVVGMEVVDKMQTMKTGAADKPVEDIKISSIVRTPRPGKIRKDPTEKRAK
jgi:cyclophilin family peptidyl-prolyl cis-trans isomerase